MNPNTWGLQGPGFLTQVPFFEVKLKETTGGEFRVYRASIKYIDLL